MPTFFVPTSNQFASRERGGIGVRFVILAVLWVTEVGCGKFEVVRLVESGVDNSALASVARLTGAEPGITSLRPSRIATGTPTTTNNTRQAINSLHHKPLGRALPHIYDNRLYQVRQNLLGLLAHLQACTLTTGISCKVSPSLQSLL
jgi:hypothetical protein